MKYLLIGLLRVYRALISPLYGQVCRYYPSCSAYALEAVQVHGSIKGSWLAVRRLARCHPWAAGGVDKVPQKGSWTYTEPDEHPDQPAPPDAFENTPPSPGHGTEIHHQGA